MVFTPTTWNEGVAPGISAAQLNRMEDGIEFGADGYIQNFSSVTALTINSAIYKTLITINLTIPTNWVTWDGFMQISFQVGAVAGDTYSLKFEIDGTDTAETEANLLDPGGRHLQSALGSLKNRTTTGSVSFRARMLDDNDGIFIRDTQGFISAQRKT